MTTDDTGPSDLTAHAARNRASWDASSDDYQERHGGQLAEHGGLAWGTTQIPEAELQVLGEVAGRDILELGCGAAQWSIALAQRGARPVGLDLSERQLEHARRLMAEAGVDFPLVHASAEAVPLPDAIVRHRLLRPRRDDLRRPVPNRPGGRAPAATRRPVRVQPRVADRDDLLAARRRRGRRPPGPRLLRDARDRRRRDVSFQLPYGEWIRLFRANGFVIEDSSSRAPGPRATSTYRAADELAWARRWPAESIWRLRRA